MTSSEPDAAAHGQEHQASLVNRYGRPKRKLGRRGLTIAAIAGLLVIVLVVLFLSQRSQRGYEPKNVSFDIIDSRHTDVTVAVSMDKDDTVTCGVQVLSEDHSVVGYKEVRFVGERGEVSGGNQRVVQHKVPIRTVFTGVTGQVSICWQD